MAVEPVLLQRRVRRVRLTIGVALLLELMLCLEVASPSARLLHLGVVFPATAASLGLLALDRFRRHVSLIAPVCFSLVGAGLVSFVMLGTEPVSVFVALAVFGMGVPALGGVSVSVGVAISACTLGASLALWAGAGGDDTLALGVLLFGGLAAGSWSGWHGETVERNDLEAHAELRRLTSRLAEQAQTDNLTGLPNRAHVQDWLEEEWERSRVEGECLSLLVVDIDHFKQVNDTFGHPVGDLVICKVAEAIQGALRGHDLAGRWGGEEFVVVLSNCPEPAVAHIAERLRRSVAAIQLQVPGHREEVRPTVSVGAATWDGRGLVEPHELIATADRALYAAKRSGRNRVRLERSLATAPVPVD